MLSHKHMGLAPVPAYSFFGISRSRPGWISFQSAKGAVLIRREDAETSEHKHRRCNARHRVQYSCLERLQ